jgi:hypothetical protein
MIVKLSIHPVVPRKAKLEYESVLALQRIVADRRVNQNRCVSIFYFISLLMNDLLLNYECNKCHLNAH